MAKSVISYTTSQNNSIFSFLKDGEKYFQNKELLSDLRTNCERIYGEYSHKLKPKFDFRHQLTFEKPTKFDYELRPQITAAEENLIKKACKRKNIHTAKIDDIKFSLGYKTENSSFKKPCIAVVGQTNAGKSSLINCILQERVVPQSMSRQTARVTRVTHCPVKFVARMENSTLIKIELEEDIKNEDVNLSVRERNKESEISIEIIAGTPNLIIQNGFDLIDSPGLNENTALNDLCSKMERSLLPILIYVIDGRNGLMQIDINDIKQINERTPNLKILYFVTKLSRSKYDRIMYEEKKEKKGLKDNEDIPGESDIEVAERRLDKVLRKLKLHAFEPVFTNILERRDFYGADIWAVNDTRIHDSKQKCDMRIDDSKKKYDEFNMKLMKWFEESLMLYLKDKLENPIREEIQYIENPLEDIIEKTTSFASEKKDEMDAKFKDIYYFNKFERDLYYKEEEYFRETFSLELKEFVKKYFEQYIEVFESNYRESSLRKKSIRQIDEKIRFVCFLQNKIFIQEIKLFLEKSVKKFHSKLDLQGIREGENSFKIMLLNRLDLEYELTDNPNKIWSDPSKCLENLSLRDSNEKPHSKIHIEINESKNAFNNDKDSLIPLIESIVTQVLSCIQNDLNDKHERFVQYLHEQEIDLKPRTVEIEEKKLLQSFTEQMAVQYAILLHLKTPLLIVIDPHKSSELIGTGGQSIVEKVHVIGQDKPIACKTYKCSFNNFQNSTKLSRISMEIYYSSRLKHPHLLQLLGIHFEYLAEGSWKFSAYYPYLEMGTLKDYLSKNGECVNLQERIRLAVQIAEGIAFMHQIHIVHRDINLSNVLVKSASDNQSKVQAFISDYGLSKSLGFLEDTDRIGTSVYRAPELLNKSYLLKYSYNKAVDVFSFGFSLWQLISFQLLPANLNYFPKFVIDCELNSDTCEKLVLDGERPEYRPSIPPRLYTLMQRCWYGNPHKRPSFIDKVSNLPVIGNEKYPMKNKTIVDELKEIKAEIKYGTHEKYDDFILEKSSNAFKFSHDASDKFAPDSENAIIGMLIRGYDEFGSVINLPLRGGFFQVAESHKESLNEAWKKIVNLNSDANICSTPYLFECAEPVTEFILLFCLKSQTKKRENMLELQGKLLPNNYINKKLKYPLVLSFEVKLNLDPTRNQERFYDQTFSGEIQLSEIDCYSKIGITIPMKSEIKIQFPQIFLKVTKVNNENVKTS